MYHLPSVAWLHLLFFRIDLRVNVAGQHCSNYKPAQEETQGNIAQVFVLVTVVVGVEVCIVYDWDSFSHN